MKFIIDAIIRIGGTLCFDSRKNESVPEQKL